jgi:phenylalanyl-tRNA synthetase beta chain
MTISYKWLCDYLPVSIEPERLAKILTSIGLEVESMIPYQAIKGNLQGLIIGEVLETEKHPNADKLTLTKVNTGEAEPLQIVCGAPNVAAGQKVVVAPVGSTIYPLTGDPLTMKIAKIRGVESQGMICAEDEIGLGNSHDGIMVLPADLVPGSPAAAYFKPYEDTIIEIGLTPNRMDAMSHIGVARDVSAYLSHHDKKDIRVKTPSVNGFKIDNQGLEIAVTIENTDSCQRYAGISISGVKVKESPQWLKDKLKSISVRSINNIVDATNFILHEYGQPLHAFDADQLAGKAIIVKNLPKDTLFVSLDEKERKLHEEDLIICDGESNPLCIGGVFGGLHSGVKDATVNIFLESAWFNPTSIRKSSLRHNLRTDAATRFEKGVDISNLVVVLKRAANLIKELAGGEISSDIIDIYPKPKERTEVGMKYHYLKKLSGKNYHPDTVKKILELLGFGIMKEGIDELWVTVPFSKPDISLPADIVEEVIRIDGLDNIDIPASITITPSGEHSSNSLLYREKAATALAGMGFNEILTNSITNSAYFSEAVLENTVKMINSLSADLNILRPSMLETGLESLAYNINRKNNSLSFFEFGKTYRTSGIGKYEETAHLCLYVTGALSQNNWRAKAKDADLYYVKGIAARVLELCGIRETNWQTGENANLQNCLQASVNGKLLLEMGEVTPGRLDRFDIKQPVFFADFYWNVIVELAGKSPIEYREVSKFPPVYRDLAIVVPKTLAYGEVELAVQKAKISKLQELSLFDIFESDKLGAGKKSMAISFTFVDEEKTLTDKEIDAMMGKIMTSFEKELEAEIRK